MVPSTSAASPAASGLAGHASRTAAHRKTMPASVQRMLKSRSASTRWFHGTTADAAAT